MASQRRARLARLSAWRRTEDHMHEKTVHGGVVTVIGASIALLLFFVELVNCLRTTYVTQMFVDESLERRMTLDFSISFPALPCGALAMEVGDASGAYDNDAIGAMHTGGVHKWQLDASGKNLHRTEYEPESRAGARRGASMDLSSSHLTAMRAELGRHEGCRVAGWLPLNRVAGDLRFFVRPEALFLSMSSAEVIAALMSRSAALHGPHRPDASSLNASHVIERFRFDGDPPPGVLLPLEHATRVDRVANGIDRYYVKVVPTVVFGDRSAWSLLAGGGGAGAPPSAPRPRASWMGRRTTQYSVTEYHKRVAATRSAEEDSKGTPASPGFLGTHGPDGETPLPGLHINYDTHPIAVRVTVGRKGFLHLLVRLCAVLGGTFALTGCTDRAVHRLIVRTRSKPRPGPRGPGGLGSAGWGHGAPPGAYATARPPAAASGWVGVGSASPDSLPVGARLRSAV